MEECGLEADGPEGRKGTEMTLNSDLTACLGREVRTLCRSSPQCQEVDVHSLPASEVRKQLGEAKGIALVTQLQKDGVEAGLLNHGG